MGKKRERTLPGGGSAATASAVRLGVGESEAEPADEALKELLVRDVRGRRATCSLLPPPPLGFFAVAAIFN